ncbi:hypothetical protein AB0D98_13655 [Streptomyces sp. NPDC047987]|uniref:hypothetical protein n=1 Tax=unclassified Streptomyces TaxID=2593676 RepID=UPI003429F572
MRTFTRELAPRGIRGNAVSPAIVDAGMARRQWPGSRLRRRARAAHPGPSRPAATGLCRSGPQGAGQNR